MTKGETPIVATIYPYSEGFGYALIQGAQKLLDYGSAVFRPVSNKKSLRRIRSFLDRSNLDVLVLRDESAKGFKGSQRTKQLLADIRIIAHEMDIFVVNYSRRHIQEAFHEYGVRTKYDIAKHLVQRIPNLGLYLPPRRKRWGSENYKMAMFEVT